MRHFRDFENSLCSGEPKISYHFVLYLFIYASSFINLTHTCFSLRINETEQYESQHLVSLRQAECRSSFLPSVIMPSAVVHSVVAPFIN